MKTFLLEIITPENIILQKQVAIAVLPAFEGELGVLAGHAPMIAQLNPGTLRYVRDQKEELLALAGGYAEITPERVRVFVEEATLAAEINAEKANQEALSLKAEIKTIHDQTDLKKAETAMRVALAKLKVAKRRR
jgi:F-type H+-transporting ATPase subunit epsilon